MSNAIEFMFGPTKLRERSVSIPYVPATAGGHEIKFVFEIILIITFNLLVWTLNWMICLQLM